MKRFILSVALVLLSITWIAAQETPGKHLFILSGQSNMAGLDPNISFIPIVEKEFGKDNVIVVKDALGGQPIRRWYKKWVDAAGKAPEQTGDLYDRLMVKVKKTIDDHELKSVSFYWMQGERDAREQHGPVYKSSFVGLIKQLQKDLGHDDIHVVIGRLSDFDMKNAKYPHWTMVRKSQVALAAELPSGAWINTDDLNDGVNKKGKQISNDLHMSVAGYKTMGERFALNGIALIKGTAPDPNIGTVDSENDGTSAEDAVGVAPDMSYQAEQKREYLAEPIISFSPKDLGDGIAVSQLDQADCDANAIKKLVRQISEDKFKNIDSLLIAHRGNLILESYFKRGRPGLPHFQMSITKSYTALALGRAKKLGYIDDFDQPVVNFLGELDRAKLAPGATEITIAECLNMHSGIRLPQKFPKSKKLELSGQKHAQWILSSSNPISKDSKEYKYQGVDPALVMQVVQSVVPGTAEEFIKQQVLSPLGIETYVWQHDLSGQPKAAAGSSLRSRDMLKFGMVILNKGVWNGKRLWSPEFIDAATAKLHTNKAGHSYGYFWWGHEVEIGAEKLRCISGRGAAGQYLIVVPKLELVVVATSHNKEKGFTQSPQRFTNATIIPAFAR